MGTHGGERNRSRVVKRRRAARARTKNITGLGGIFVPSSGIVSYREVTAAMAKIFQARGGEIIYNAEVSALSEHKKRRGDMYPSGR